MPLRLLHHRSHHQSHAAMTNQQPPTIFFLATNRKTYSRRHHHEPPPRFVPPKSQPLIVAPRFATTISTKPSHCETCRKSQQDHLAITESRVIHRLHRTISKPTSQIADAYRAHFCSKSIALHACAVYAEFNHVVEFLLLISFNESALSNQVEDALASLASMMSESPSLLVQFTQGEGSGMSSWGTAVGVGVSIEGVGACDGFGAFFLCACDGAFLASTGIIYASVGVGGYFCGGFTGGIFGGVVFGTGGFKGAIFGGVVLGTGGFTGEAMIARIAGCAMMTEMNPNGDAAGSGSAVAISAMLMEDEHEYALQQWHLTMLYSNGI
ncbi:uncharacterized protein HKW66_Vig0119780 [Vigna angularis]|uniref:Uncharacterized protein n=1 Tax=Phaseolus angularis TaxID=3914 RepID=A0A8T0JWE4_PHAAN|nr:uncharacterized protein HKW66_Vig0119780 [Vigna angularis]